ncbi:MAG: FAD-dependent oxidoreductase [Sulfurospirillaceae bacterium]|nr:FAD-dependent oxidoreductase [Sulfurospirillaceae bacterium]
MFDFAIIGGGISGASIAYFLKRSGKKVILIDKGKIASGGSSAAGAFLSPKICSNSKYSRFINESFKFSINFYRENFPNFLRQDGMLRLLKNKEDIEKCKHHDQDIGVNSIYIHNYDIKYLKPAACEFGGYFFEDGALIDSVGVIKSMLRDICVLEDTDVQDISYKEGIYNIGDVKSKSVVLCSGSSDNFEEVKYCMFKKIYGHRLDIRTYKELPFIVHKDYSVSSSKDGLIHIGATHIPNYKYDTKKDYADEINSMLQAADSYLDLGEYELLDTHFGVRTSTIDFFPAIGQVINAEETLNKYPYIRKGSKVPSDRYIYYPNLYIHSGHGARGFVLSPRTASILANHISKNVPIDDNLNTKRLFLKYSRR